ncbi:MAG: 8-amino-7-oxononanoate synthase [Planctomycetes bacterium]|nr:8-amino-7-oxononanoate synthase [Planctomycetota bacterium]
MTNDNFIHHTLQDLRGRGLYRALVAVGSAAGPRVRLGGREVLQFASNNYLGLAADPRVKEAACRAVGRWGWGAGASRLLAGHTDAHAALEADLAAFKGAQAALVFPSGYAANLGVLAALAGRGDAVVCDREDHASIYDAVRLSGADLARYPHADAAAAAELLRAAPAAPPRRDSAAAVAGRRHGEPESLKSEIRNLKKSLLVTDTVFSMGGDLAPLAALAGACRDAGAILVVDEAHALGILGPTGAGLVEALQAGAAGAGVAGAVTASVGTLSKALGGVGGFVAARQEVIDLLVNRARPFIYTTALPAAACEAARAALAIVRAEPERRRRVLALAARLRARLRECGFDCGRSETPIVPVIVGQPEAALAIAGRLLDGGIFCPAVRPPTVPHGSSRLRVSLTSEHTEDDVEQLVRALAAARAAT